MKILRTTLLVLSAALSLIFASCEFFDDDEPLEVKTKSIYLQYQSVDATGNEITLSEYVRYPVSGVKIKKVVLSSHFTIGSNSEAPTSELDRQLISNIASKESLLVCPDLIGFGSTKNQVHPYLSYELSARNSIDGLTAAIKYLSYKKILFDSDYYTLNVGYSEGGFTALAVQKYLETQCDSLTGAIVRLKATFCGDGPYNIIKTFDEYIAKDEISYTCAIPMIILGAKAAHPNEMAGINVEDYFKTAFVSAGILDDVKAKSMTTGELNKKISALGTKISDLMVPGALTPGNNLYDTLKNALRKDVISEGWTPQKPVFLFHSTTDDVVPFVNYQEAINNLGGAVHGTTFNDLKHIEAAVPFFASQYLLDLL